MAFKFNMRAPVFFCCALVMLYLLLESVSFAVYSLAKNVPFSFSGIEEQRISILDSMDGNITHQTVKGRGSNAYAWHGAHPYLGYARYKRSPLLLNGLNGYMTYDDYGFRAEQDPLIASADPNNVIVALLGGSVAEGQYKVAESLQMLHSYLDNLPIFKGKKVVICMFGLIGYTQPQQALAVTYYLLQGGRLDIVINLDGRNETILPSLSMRSGMPPSYPLWYREFFPFDTSGMDLDALARTMIWNNIRRKAANISRALDFSITASVLWSLFDSWCDKEIRSIQKSKLEFLRKGLIRPSDKSAEAHLKSIYRGITTDNIDDFKLTLWIQGSLHLYNLSKIHGFHYFHFLQPNQYAPQGKPKIISDKIYRPDTDEGRYVQEMYPKFIDAIPSLRAKGVNVYDLTGIFKNVNKEVYVDFCCHYSTLGRVIVSEEMGRRIKAYFESDYRKHHAKK